MGEHEEVLKAAKDLCRWRREDLIQAVKEKEAGNGSADEVQQALDDYCDAVEVYDYLRNGLAGIVSIMG